MNPLKKLASQTAIYGLPSILGRLLNYLLIPLFTRKFNEAEFGVVNDMYAYVSFLIIVLTCGMETTLFRFSQTEQDKEKVYTTSLIYMWASAILFIAAIISFAGPISELLRYPNNQEYVIWFAIIIAIDALTAIPFARLREQGKAYRFAFVKMVNIGVNIGLNLFFVGFCKTMYDNHNPTFYNFVSKIYDPEIKVGYIFICNLVASFSMLLLLAPEMFKVKYRFDFAMWKRMMLYALPLLVAGLAGMVNETLDRILIKYLYTPTENALAQVGIYGACYRISIIMTIFIQAFRYAAEPFFFSHAKEKDSKQLYADVMKYFVIFCLIIFLSTMLNLDWIKYFVGRAFRVGLPVVPILLLANLFLGVFFNLSIWYKLSGQTRFGAYLTIFGAIITLTLNYYWIPRIGYMGSAWATFICYAFMMILSYFWGNKHYPVNYDLKRILGYFALSLILYYLSTFVHLGNQAAELVIKNLLLLVFFAAVYLNEKAELKSFIKSKVV